MKLDKETIVKHQFWFLLGTFVVVWLVGVFWLKVAASEPIKKAKDKVEGSENRLKKASADPVNVTKWVPPWNEYGKTFDGHKRVIWDKAWNYQKDMFDWPETLRSKDMYSFQVDLTPDERDQFKNDLYNKEVDSLRQWLTPPNSFLGPVELKGGFDSIFQPQKWTDTPTREECWLAQEDFWVKRELFYVVGSAVLGQSFMYPVEFTKEEEKENPKPEGVIERYRFRNRNWEVTLHIRENDDKQPVVGWDSTIKNVHPSRATRPLISAKGGGLVFTVFQGNNQMGLEVQGEPVAYGVAQVFNKEKGNYDPSGKDDKDDKDKKDKKDKTPKLAATIKWAKGHDKDNLIGMSQSFDESTCPIRRVDALALGKQSCRTYTMPLQPNEALVKLDAPAEDPDAKKDVGGTPGGGFGGVPGGNIANMGPGAGAGGKAPGGAGVSGGAGGTPGGMGGTPGGAGGAPGGGATASQNLTPNNNLERNRYLQPPKKDKDEADRPSRHLPLAVQLVVDQGHMQDVLMAMANSRLRIQITQVEINHLKDYKPQSDKKGGGSAPGAGGMGLFVPPDMSSMYRGSMSQGMPAGGNTPPGGPMPPRGGGSGNGPPGGAQGGSSPDFQAMYGNAGPMMRPGFGGKRPPRAPSMTILGAGGMERGSLINRPDTNKKKTAQSQGDQNLVEMTVYGIATLYRRPDPPKTDAQSGQPVQPGQPGQPGTPAPPVPPAGPNKR